jgi:hypothetical protein
MTTKLFLNCHKWVASIMKGKMNKPRGIGYTLHLQKVVKEKGKKLR